VLRYCYSSCQCSRTLSLSVVVYCYRQCYRNVTVTVGGRVLLLLLSVLRYYYCNGRVPVTVSLLQCSLSSLLHKMSLRSSLYTRRHGLHNRKIRMFDIYVLCLLHASITSSQLHCRNEGPDSCLYQLHKQNAMLLTCVGKC
jgi:hypothetical protein